MESASHLPSADTIPLTPWTKASLLFLRVALGWMYFYAGITKVLDPSWSAAKYLSGAKTFSGFYAWLMQPESLPAINIVNKWGLLLLGISLILGIGVRLSSILGAALMFLYYLPILQFPRVGQNSFLVDQHIIFIGVLLFFAAIRAGRIWGLEAWCSRLPICRKFPKWRQWLG